MINIVIYLNLIVEPNILHLRNCIKILLSLKLFLRGIKVVVWAKKEKKKTISYKSMTNRTELYYLETQ